MNEDFVTYELAVKLKEKGFRERVKGYYSESKGLSVCNTPMNSNALDNEFSAPTISQVLKWLREEKKLHLEISFWSTTETWSCKVVKITNLPDGEWNVHKCKSYEDAAIKAIEHLLKYWI